MTVIYTCEDCGKRQSEDSENLHYCCECGCANATLTFEGEEKMFNVVVTTENEYLVHVKARDPVEAKLKADHEYGILIEAKQTHSEVVENE